jgi:hypothetical protein
MSLNVYNISSISLIISLLGFGSAIKRWLSTGRISDLTTVGVKEGEALRYVH